MPGWSAETNTMWTGPLRRPCSNLLSARDLFFNYYWLVLGSALYFAVVLWPGNTVMTLLFRSFWPTKEQSVFLHSQPTSNGFSSLSSDLQGFLAGHARQQPWALGQHRKHCRTHRSERIGRFVFCACVHSCFNTCFLNHVDLVKPILLMLNDYSY